MDKLFYLAKRVAETHNGKHYPRIEQIEAMKALQAYFTTLEKTNQSQATNVQVSGA